MNLESSFNDVDDGFTKQAKETQTNIDIITKH